MLKCNNKIIHQEERWQQPHLLKELQGAEPSVYHTCLIRKTSAYKIITVTIMYPEFTQQLPMYTLCPAIGLPFLLAASDQCTTKNYSTHLRQFITTNFININNIVSFNARFNQPDLALVPESPLTCIWLTINNLQRNTLHVVFSVFNAAYCLTYSIQLCETKTNLEQLSFLFLFHYNCIIILNNF